MVMGAVLMLGLSSCAKGPSSLVLSFDYVHQSGPGSNQYAVWVENQAGEVVKTLFVTSFTTKGPGRGNMQGTRGYTFRPTCVTEWLAKADPESLSDEQLDAFTGATPSGNGVQTFTWDFTNDKGEAVPAGDYVICVNATLRNASTVLYKGSFSTKGKPGPVSFETSYNEPDNQECRDMITNVKAELK